MDKLLEKAFPKSISLDIFPIRSVEEMEHFEENAEMFPKNDVICGIKECITKSLQFIITEECLLEYNWDGLQKKKSLKKSNLFGKFVFDALKFPEYGFPNYENNIKKSIQLIKNRVYKNVR
ncbi:uncharacterized protein LOC120774628 [Bactrocera tryoni]|uniref:uncharacterized protein LOC120774628 n=1 Tax=Bactrocera tryoni TaxID=59916 RepID=UPI001A983BA7|nr:uncharacterized protein LOC120774628 [Bactrocera tryoni]